MDIRKLAYALAIVMVSYDVLSTLIASKLYGQFADLSPLYNFLGQNNPTYFCILMVIVIALLIISFLTALLYVKNQELSVRILILCCDFWAVYLLIFEAVAIPHNTMVLFGSYGIVPSSEMFIIQEIVSASIAGVIVVIADWKRLLRRNTYKNQY